MRIFTFNFLQNAYQVYQKHFVHVLVLELFCLKGPLTNEEIYKYLLQSSRIPWEITSGITFKYIEVQVKYLTAIGLITLHGQDKIAITQKGVDALSSGIFHTLSSSAFFGLLGATFAYLTVIISVLALLISLKCK